uniref:Gamma-glutamylcyclotransferase family protein n=1 Tax=Vannella robusta TaxID=1487602 RepID=A0A7S4HYE5_9EUKA
MTYGTLKKSFHNHHLLLNASFVCRARTKEPVFQMIQLQSRSKKGVYCPGAVPGSSHIVGEVYSTDDEGLAILDKLEEQNIRYTRELIEIQTYSVDPAAKSTPTAAWMYMHTLPDEAKFPDTQVDFNEQTNSYDWRDVSA